MKTSRSAVFLFELMIIILVFTLAAAICASIFASAFKISTESRELTMSSINAQTVAEQFKAGKADIESLYFDKDWVATDAANAYYSIELDEQNESPQMRNALVNVYRTNSGEAILTIRVKEFTG